MSKLKSLIIALALGSSSVAMADTSFTASAHASWSFGTRPTAPAPVIRDHRTPPAPVVRDHRTPRPTTTRPPVYVRGVAGTYERADRYDRGEQMIFPTNTRVGLGASVYTGESPTYKRPGQTVALTDPTRIDSTVLYVGASEKLGPLSALSFQNTVGATKITMVKILYRSGAWQVVRSGSTLDRMNPTFQISLDRYDAIERIEVFGETGRGSAFQVMAR